MKEQATDVFLVTLVIVGTSHLFARDNQDLVVAGNKMAQAKVLNIKSYGAVGDGVAMDTQAIQKTIDACHAEGGGIVRIPRGDFQIGTIHLRSNVTLSLDYGAELLGSQDIKDYPIDKLRPAREGNSECLLYAEDATNIRLEGLGVIDGRGTPEFFPRRSGPGGKDNRPRLIRFENCLSEASTPGPRQLQRTCWEYLSTSRRICHWATCFSTFPKAKR